MTATNINTIAAVIEEGLHLTVQAVVEALHIPCESICKILMQELGLKCVCAVWILSVEVPKGGQEMHVLLPLADRGCCLSAMRVCLVILVQLLFMAAYGEIVKIFTPLRIFRKSEVQSKKCK